MIDYTELVKFLRGLSPWSFPEASKKRMHEAAAAIEELQAAWIKSETDATNLTGRLAQAEEDVERLQDKLCDWCAVCPKERRKPEDCELLSETPVMYGPSDAKMEVQDGQD